MIDGSAWTVSRYDSHCRPELRMLGWWLWCYEDDWRRVCTYLLLLPVRPCLAQDRIVVVVLWSCSLNNSEFRASNSDKWSYGHLWWWWLISCWYHVLGGWGINLWPRGAPTAIHLLFMLLANCTDQLDGWCELTDGWNQITCAHKLINTPPAWLPSPLLRLLGWHLLTQEVRKNKSN